MGHWSSKPDLFVFPGFYHEGKGQRENFFCGGYLVGSTLSSRTRFKYFHNHVTEIWLIKDWYVIFWYTKLCFFRRRLGIFRNASEVFWIPFWKAWNLNLYLLLVSGWFDHLCVRGWSLKLDDFVWPTTDTWVVAVISKMNEVQIYVPIFRTSYSEDF